METALVEALIYILLLKFCKMSTKYAKLMQCVALIRTNYTIIYELFSTMNYNSPDKSMI